MHRHHPGVSHREAANVSPAPHRQPRAAHGRGGKVAAFAAVALLSGWAGTATLFILFRDDALKLIVERQVAITSAYEAQARQQQAEIDRLRSLKLIDQERVDRTVAELTRRQTLLETRQSALITFGQERGRDRAPEIVGSVPTSREAQRTPAQAKPIPLSDTILLAPPAERWSRLESRPVPPIGGRIDTNDPTTATDVRVGNLARELERLEMAQGRALNDLEERYDGREQRMRKVFADLGLPKNARWVRSLAGKTSEAAAGGPFLPWLRPVQDPFTRQVHRIRTTARSVQALEQEIAAVPVRRPTSGEADVTSAFGVRLDPFVRQLAMHTGVDFRGEPGDPVRAAAAGKVVQAERNGGYGLMVEIDHGNGIASRYAHLSSIAVEAGGDVVAGAQIGRVGTTGRSTGPHLHYEVRVNGEPVDPQRFLRAGLRLDPPH
jgi:murein DD-endopeptidase MepM/ murein hydrolase activator NlpD